MQTTTYVQWNITQPPKENEILSLEATQVNLEDGEGSKPGAAKEMPHDVTRVRRLKELISDGSESRVVFTWGRAERGRWVRARSSDVTVHKRVIMVRSILVYTSY